MDADFADTERCQKDEKEDHNKKTHFLNDCDDDAVVQQLCSDSPLPGGSGSTVKFSQIQAINPKVVHKICSGQVIVNLSTAVKELVENSIDAGATNIEIRLTEYGSKIIEVSDNGMGVEESNLEGLTLKHHTSKISDFEDLTSIGTFGFRGEALSSLCTLAKLSVTTKSEISEGPAYRVEYDLKGKIVKKVTCARKKGTTVILEDLFWPLSVRQKQFHKNLKREFNKMINVLYGYCLISKGIRINCTNQCGKGISRIVSIPALPTMKERIATLFGTKEISSLLEINQCTSVPEQILEEFGLSDESYYCSTKYTLDGFISAPNKGRSTNDRQFFWINSRPCEPTKVSRLINEVYHMYSRHQNPFVCLHIQTKQEEVDVNVTPDKRVIYLQNEKILCATLKATLLSLFLSASSNFDSLGQQMVALSGTLRRPLDEALPTSSVRLSADTYHSSVENVTQKLKIKHDKITFASSPQRMTNLKNLIGGFAKRTSVAENSKANFPFRQPFNEKSSASSQDTTDKANFVNPPLSPIYSCKISRAQTDAVQRFEITAKKESCHDESESMDSLGNSDDLAEEYDDSPFFFGNSSSQKENESISTVEAEGDMFLSSVETSEYQSTDSPMYDDEFDDDFNPNQISVSLKVNWDKINLTTTDTNCVDKKEFHRKFRAKISPTENASAEDELKKQITKDMFCNMKIIGQFNLGFILVKSGPDMFIVDQHASDEKYNFETLEKTMVLTGQTLIRPMDLQLPAISENIIIDNLDIFQKNGFDFEINAEGNPSTRIKMTKIPYSKSVQFGKTDVEELIFMMEDCPEQSFCRPSKIREMLASRACRQSVMIGKAMNHQEMRTLVNNMGLINQPWNCPHGRPTIRHVLNLNILPDLDLNVFNH